jgi:hypothetical protein
MQNDGLRRYVVNNYAVNLNPIKERKEVTDGIGKRQMKEIRQVVLKQDRLTPSVDDYFSFQSRNVSFGTYIYIL